MAEIISVTFVAGPGRKISFKPKVGFKSLAIPSKSIPSSLAPPSLLLPPPSNGGGVGVAVDRGGIGVEVGGEVQAWLHIEEFS